MARRHILHAAIAGLVGFVVSSAVSSYTNRAQPVNLEDLSNWILIKRYTGEVNPREPAITLRVHAIYRLSGPDPDTILQNRIEVTQERQTHVFMWPDNKIFVAGWCQVQDVDGDASKEFLLFGGDPLVVRVVSYSRGRFLFERKRDELLSLNYDIGPVDLDGDGNLEFIEGDPFPERLDSPATRISLPRIRRWTRAEGFKDVSREFPNYYKSVVIPELQSMKDSDSASERRELYSQAIEYIHKEILGH